MSRLAPDPDDARFIRRLLILLALSAMVIAAWKAAHLLILVFGSILGAIVIRATADLYAARLRLSARLALGLAIASVLATLAFLGWLLGVQFGGQINLLVMQLPHLLDQLAAWMAQSPVGAKIVDAVRAAFAGSRIAQDIGALVRGAGELALNSLLLLVGALFFSIEPKIYIRGALLLVPRDKRPVFADALEDVGVNLRLWLQAQLLLMTTMGVLVALGLWLAGVPSAAALGLLAGLSEFIPYIGPAAAMLPALGLAATAGTGPLIGALITYAVVRLCQSSFITPWVQRRVIAIPPAITLFAIVAIGMVFGLFGLFFSAALLVVIFTLIRSLYLRDVLGEELDGPP